MDQPLMFVEAAGVEPFVAQHLALDRPARGEEKAASGGNGLLAAFQQRCRRGQKDVMAGRFAESSSSRRPGDKPTLMKLADLTAGEAKDLRQDLSVCSPSRGAREGSPLRGRDRGRRSRRQIPYPLGCKRARAADFGPKA